MRLRPVLAVRSLLPDRRSARPRPSRRRSARAAVGCGLVGLYAALVAMAVAVETAVPQWRDPEYGHRLKQVRHWKATCPDRPLVVALGTSRTEMGLSPADMGFADAAGSPVVYNFGLAGAGPLHQYLTFRRLLDDGERPDFLLIELFPAALVADGPAEVQVARWVPRLGAGDLRRLEPYCENPAALRRAWADTRSNSWYSLRETLMSHWLPGWLPWPKRVDFRWSRLDEHGWLPYPFEVVPEADRRKGVEKAHQEYAVALAHHRVGAATDRALREVLSRCRGAGIPAAFYLMPEGPAFAGWYTPETRASVVAFRAAIGRDYGVPVFDAAGGFAEDEFADSHHLLRSGAARFSRKLADEYVREWTARGR